MNRRRFIKMLSLGVAPAFVKAENLMGLWIPKQEIEIYPAEFGEGLSYVRGNQSEADRFLQRWGDLVQESMEENIEQLIICNWDESKTEGMTRWNDEQ